MSEGHCLRTVHAEMNAVNQAASTGIYLVGLWLYTTHLPCSSCMERIEAYEIKPILVGIA
jgi:dCMP deaminase